MTWTCWTKRPRRRGRCWRARPEPWTSPSKRSPACREMTVRLRPERLLQYGFAPVDVLDAIQTAYQGDDRVADLRGQPGVRRRGAVWTAKDREDPEAIGSLQLRNAQGTVVPLRELAEVRPSNGRYSVIHEGAQRLQQVTCNVHGRDVASFAAEVKRRFEAQVSLPPGVFVVYTGSALAEAQARHQLLVHSLLAGAGIVLLLALLVWVRTQLAADPREPALCAGRRGAGGVRHRRLVVHRLAGRLRDAVRHHHAQFDHDDFALRASGDRGRHDLGTGGGHARRVGAAAADPHDGDW